MNTQIRALVVEDDPKTRDRVETELMVLGHAYDMAESQQEAHELLATHDYQYALVDLEIPVRVGRGAQIDYGIALIHQIRQIKGRGVLPVIVMTGHHRHGLNFVLELQGKGVMDFIAKPFGNRTEGKSLAEVIRSVLDRHRASMPNEPVLAEDPEPFKGGTLTFYDDHVELNGVNIVEATASPESWQVLQALLQARTGRSAKLSAPRLAKAIDPSGRLSEGAVNSRVHTLRQRIAGIMLDEQNVTVGRDDVIANGTKGYHLSARVAVECSN